MDADGSARVTGAGAAYFLRTPGPPEQCAPNTALTYRNISVYRLTGRGGTVQREVVDGSGGVEYKLSVENGVVESSLPGNRIY